MTTEPWPWREQAACRGADPDLFFPVKGGTAQHEVVVRAKAICALCPVSDACLDHALAHGERQGIWGGLTERERRPLRSPRPEAACGTRSGYQRHLRTGEAPCHHCREACAAYQRPNRAAL